MRSMRLAWLSGLAIAVAVCPLFGAPAGTGNTTQADTTKSPKLYYPPRVITPEDTASSARGAVPRQEAGMGEMMKKHGEAAKSPQVPKAGCPLCPGGSRPRYGGGGGPVPGYLSANLEKINPKVRAMGIPEISEGMFIMGGKGCARLNYLIIGGGGYGGTSETSGIPDGCARYAKVEIGYGGGIIGLAKGCSRCEAAVGMLVGGGGVKVTRERSSRNVFGWDDSWDIFREDEPDSVATDDLNVTSSMTATFIALEPFIEFKIWIFPFMALDISASYLRAHIDRGSWKLERVKIPDSPETNIGGPSYKLGLHFGV